MYTHADRDRDRDSDRDSTWQLDINIMVIKYCTINYRIVRLNLINYPGCCVLTIITE